MRDWEEATSSPAPSFRFLFVNFVRQKILRWEMYTLILGVIDIYQKSPSISQKMFPIMSADYTTDLQDLLVPMK